MQPLIHRRRIGEDGGAMVECATALQARWHDGETRDIHDEMTRLTLAVVGRVLFAADLGERRPRWDGP